ncbi:hypothetical protein ACYKTQ_13485, partial [Klebsiella pneumoniae]|nr:hypothetical protein [Klebsiella pneumoniae]MCQ5429028.1 hypothetical protein [Klebsiella pneumoniae]
WLCRLSCRSSLHVPCRGENTRSKCPFKFDHNIIALTPEQHALGDMASAILPLPADPQQARYALLLLVDLLNDTLIA